MNLESWRVAWAALVSVLLVAMAHIDIGPAQLPWILGGLGLYAALIAGLKVADGVLRRRREAEAVTDAELDAIRARAIGGDDGDSSEFKVPVGGDCIGDLKSWQVNFAEIWARRRPFQVRINDRDYRVGQVWCLNEYIPSDIGPDGGAFTGRWVKVVITSIVYGPSPWGIVEGSCVWGFWIIDMGISPRGSK